MNAEEIKIKPIKNLELIGYLPAAPSYFGLAERNRTIFLARARDDDRIIPLVFASDAIKQEKQGIIVEHPIIDTDSMSHFVIMAVLCVILGAALVGFAWYLSARNTPNQAEINPVTTPAIAPINAQFKAVLLDDFNSRSSFLRSISYSKANLKGNPSLIFDNSEMTNPSSSFFTASNHNGVNLFDCSSISFKCARRSFCSGESPYSLTSSVCMYAPSCFLKTISEQFAFFKQTVTKVKA